MLELICDKIGVEVGYSWSGDNGKRYMINEYGQVRVWNNEYDEWIESYYNLGHIITGEIKPVWSPKKGEWYCFPEVAYSIKYGVGIWKDDKWDKERLKRRIVFKTKDEAIECANKMLDSIK